MKSLLFFLCFCSGVCCAQSPQWNWAVSGTDVGGINSRVNRVIVDHAGNVIAVGSFENLLLLDTITLNNSSSGGYLDAFVAKFNATGQVIWAKKISGPMHDECYGLEVDSFDNIYIAGYFTATALLDTFTRTSAGNEDVFICKLDSAGNFVWVQTGGGSLGDKCMSLCLDNVGHLYCTGHYADVSNAPYGSATFGSVTLNAQGENGIFIAKYDVMGNFIWAKSLGGKFPSHSYDIAADKAGGVSITGGFSDPWIDFDLIRLNTKSGGFGDMFIAKYDSSGNALWARGAGGYWPTYGVSTTIDASGNLIVAGFTESPVISFGTIALGSDNAFIAKYSPSGTLAWAKNAGYTSHDDVNDMAMDGAGNLYLTGRYNGTGIYGADTFTNAGHDDIYVAKFNSNGNNVWAAHAGGANSDEGYGIAVAPSGDVYVGGYFSGTANFGSSQVSGCGNCGADPFLARLSQPSGIGSLSYAGNDVHIYPNPAQDQITIQLKGKEYTDITLTDATGRTVLQSKLKEEKAILSTAPLSNGVYYLEIKGKGVPQVKKLVVQH